jgi:hypothetical protein
MWIFSGLTPEQFVPSIVQTLVMAVACRLLLWAWGKKPPREWIFWGCSIVAFFLLVTVVSSVLGTDKRPRLKARILGVMVGDMQYVPKITPKDSPRGAGLVNLVVEISNTGAPSIATDYTLTITFPSGAKKVAQQIAIPPKGFTMPHISSGASETFYAEDYLPRKTIQPIPKGGCVQGIMVFMVQGASMGDLKAIGVNHHLEFKDLWGASYYADIQNNGMEDNLMAWPGIRDSTGNEPEPEITLPSPSPTARKEASPH